MKTTLTPLPESLPAYDPATIFLEYFVYLYESLPTKSKKVGTMGLKELHAGFQGTYESILKSIIEDGLNQIDYRDDDFKAPILELEALVRLYSPDVASYTEYKSKRSSRTARIDEILLELE